MSLSTSYSLTRMGFDVIIIICAFIILSLLGQGHGEDSRRTISALVRQERLALPCFTSESRAVDWLHETTPLFEEGTKVTDVSDRYELQLQPSTRGYHLIIHNLTTSDNGMYICKEKAGRIGKKHLWHVQIEDTFTFSRPSHATKVEIVGQTVPLCPTSSRDVTKIHRDKASNALHERMVAGGIIKESFLSRFVNSKGQLALVNVTTDDSGRYLCVSDGGSSQVLLLIAADTRSIDVNRTADTGDTVVLSCQITDKGTPPWIKTNGDYSIPVFDGHSVLPAFLYHASVYVTSSTRQSNLILENVQPGDSGNYTCLTESAKIISLTVRGTGEPSPTATDMSNLLNEMRGLILESLYEMRFFTFACFVILAIIVLIVLVAVGICCCYTRTDWSCQSCHGYKDDRDRGEGHNRNGAKTKMSKRTPPPTEDSGINPADSLESVKTVEGTERNCGTSYQNDSASHQTSLLLHGSHGSALPAENPGKCSKQTFFTAEESDTSLIRNSDTDSDANDAEQQKKCYTKTIQELLRSHPINVQNSEEFSLGSLSFKAFLDKEKKGKSSVCFKPFLNMLLKLALEKENTLNTVKLCGPSFNGFLAKENKGALMKYKGDSKVVYQILLAKSLAKFDQDQEAKFDQDQEDVIRAENPDCLTDCSKSKQLDYGTESINDVAMKWRSNDLENVIADLDFNGRCHW